VVSLNGGRRFAVYDAVPPEFELSEMDQKKLNQFAEGSLKEAPNFPALLALPTTDSVIVAMQFLHFTPERKKRSSTLSARKILRLLVVQRNGTFLLWEWRRARKRRAKEGAQDVPSYYKWVYMARGFLPRTAPQQKGSQQASRRIRAAVASVEHGYMCWEEESPSLGAVGGLDNEDFTDGEGSGGAAQSRIYGAEVPAIVAMSFKDVIDPGSATVVSYDHAPGSLRLVLARNGLFLVPRLPETDGDTEDTNSTSTTSTAAATSTSSSSTTTTPIAPAYSVLATTAIGTNSTNSSTSKPTNTNQSNKSSSSSSSSSSKSSSSFSSRISIYSRSSSSKTSTSTITTTSTSTTSSTDPLAYWSFTSRCVTVVLPFHCTT
jgi:hypothetical protein